MKINDLVSEAETLTRKCFLLTEKRTDSGVVAYWGGERMDIPNQPPPGSGRSIEYRHVVTVSEKLFTALGLLVADPITLVEWVTDSIYIPESNKPQIKPEVPATTIRQRPSKQFAELSCSGRPLYAVPSFSFPPFEAVCLYGSGRVYEWLHSLGLGRHDYWHPHLGEVANEFIWEFQKRSEFYASNADVIVGGWPKPWGDHCYPPAELRLLFLTRRDAEPWFEAWYSPVTGRCYAESKIT